MASDLSLADSLEIAEETGLLAFPSWDALTACRRGGCEVRGVLDDVRVVQRRIHERPIPVDEARILVRPAT